MKKMKWLPLLLVMALLASLVVGCSSGKQAETQPTNPPVKQEVKTVTIEQVADKYFAEMPDHIYKIPEADLKARVDANDSTMLVIDLRKAEDYAKGHIKGAVNIPFGKVHEYLDKLPADKELIVACYTGQTAGQTVAIMNMYGYNARSLNLGVDAGWVKKNNFPLDTTVNELPANVTPAKPDANIAKILKDYYVNMPENVHKINSADLQKLIENGDDIQIVDLRKPEDFAKGHVKNAINIPFGEVNKNFGKFATNKPVFVYCYTGQTAGQTVAVLNVLGIDARSVHAGFDLGWTAEGFPVEK
ncbi:MAG TPA: rhodanese-like domain-containing protein [Syntrophomonas sp.]|nr:rhodanese-like domain-containing protein [Syntrophomonas sp.]